jgi:hypothetical protein
MSAGLPQKYKDAKVEDVQSLFVFPTEGESTRTEYRLCGSFVFIDYNVWQVKEVTTFKNKII